VTTGKFLLGCPRYRRSAGTRPIAPRRKNALFAGYEAGAENWAMLAARTGQHG
jgi:hypothetical protein